MPALEAHLRVLVEGQHRPVEPPSGQESNNNAKNDDEAVLRTQ